MSAPHPPEGQFMTTAFWHFALGIAASKKGLIATAEKERESLEDSRQAVPAELDFSGYSNKARKSLDLAIAILDARIAWAKGDRTSAIERWQNAITIEDSLRYSEPPDWYYPVRESLGAALLLCGRSVEAERVFRADLERNPGNPRSLFGLWRSLESQKNSSVAEEAHKKFLTLWRRADIPTATLTISRSGRPSSTQTIRQLSITAAQSVLNVTRIQME
jgi:tetratricopeptide (TPR) repeat protein